MEKMAPRKSTILCVRVETRLDSRSPICARQRVMEQCETLPSRPVRFDVSSCDICQSHPNMDAVLQGEMCGNPSVLPVANFHANQDAAILRSTLKSFVLHSRKLFNIICCRCNWQRQEIAKTFNLMYGKNLIKKLKSRLSGDADESKRRLLLALMLPTAVYDAKQLRKAMQRLLISLCDCNRDETEATNQISAAEDASKLYAARRLCFGLESCFIEVLTKRNFKQLLLIFSKYEEIAHQSVEAAIEQDFSGSFRDGLLAIAAITRNKSVHFANLLHKYLKSLRKHEPDLVRLIVSRSECDMADIRSQYEILYKKSVAHSIRKYFSGSYRNALIALVEGNSQNSHISTEPCKFYTSYRF